MVDNVEYCFVLSMLLTYVVDNFGYWVIVQSMLLPHVVDNFEYWLICAEYVANRMWLIISNTA